jgi:iron complex outermembrane receptor protein
LRVYPHRLPKSLVSVLGLTLAVLSALGHASGARDPAGQQVDLPTSELTNSLERLARQFGIQIIYDASELRDFKSKPVHGDMAARQALAEVLSGTPFHVVEEKPDAYLVTRDPPPKAAQTRLSQVTSSEAHTLDEVVVTGTHLRGEPPIGAVLSTYDRDDLARLGVYSVEALGRSLIPNFSGADALATVNTNGNVGSLQQGASVNVFGGTAFNLLGLGPGSTLTLLNGHRIAPGGLDGSLVDVSLIPLSAIDHIDVLTDGASAIYGSDAVAGVVNLVTRRSNGMETSVEYGRSTRGGAGHYAASQTGGWDWSGGDLLVDYEYDDSQGLDASQRDWIADEAGPYSLIPRNRRHSIFASATEALALYQFTAIVLYSTRQFQTEGIALAASAFEPVSDSGSGHADLSWIGLTVERALTSSWRAELTASYSGMRQRRDGLEYPSGYGGPFYASTLVGDSDVEDLVFSSSGNLLRLPAGAARASFGGGWRAESFEDSVLSDTPLAQVLRSRTDTNLFGEMRLPLLGGEFSFPGARRLAISFAVRYDSYSHTGSTTNPKWGWVWEPLEGLIVRGTEGKSFQAPLLAQLNEPLTAYTTLLPNDKPGGAPTDTLVVNGGNPSLQSQRSHFVTAGVDWIPPKLPGLKTSATYFNVKYDYRIQAQNITNKPFDQQPQLIAISSLSPSLSIVQGYFDVPGFQGDAAGLGPGAVTAIVDNRLANVATTEVQGASLSSRASAPFRASQIGISMEGQYLLVDRTHNASYVPLTPVASTVGEPPKFRGRAVFSWDWREFSANFLINHSSRYDNPSVAPPERVSSWTTEDLNLTLSIPPVGSWTSHSSLGLSIQNVTDRRPPNVQLLTTNLAAGRAGIPYDGTNASPVGRFVALQFRLGW